MPDKILTPGSSSPQTRAATADSRATPAIEPWLLGSATFRRDYRVRLAYLTGSMYKGIASKELVVAMGQAGLMGYLGTGGLDVSTTEAALAHIGGQLGSDKPFGANLLADINDPLAEDRSVDIFLRHGVRFVEAAAFAKLSPSVIRYRLHGAKRLPDGSISAPNRVLAKVSHPDVAEAFMRPAPEALLRKLVEAGRITAGEALLASAIPVAQEVCFEADSGGHTDRKAAIVLLPAFVLLRDRINAELKYTHPVHLGTAGGIGTPQAVAAAFIMGADFVMTGSINQCTVEAGTSDAVKNLLQDMAVQDTDYAPAGDMFEIGAKVQVLKKGVLFPPRANKLYDLYTRHNSLDEIDPKTIAQIETAYFKRSIDEVWAETKAYLLRRGASPHELESNPKRKMAAIFRWYFVHSTRLAMSGSDVQKVDYQVHSGPALGAFNAWVHGTTLQDWRERRVADIAERLMTGAAELLSQRFGHWAGRR